MPTVSRPTIAVHVVPPELDDLLSDDGFWAEAEDARQEPEPFQAPAGLDWPAELPAHLPFEETVQAAQRDADKHARNAGREMRYPYLAGVMSAYLEMVLRDYALAGKVLAEARSRIEFLEDCLEGGRS